MGQLGATESSPASASAENLQSSLSRLGNIRIRKMFGGYGVFEDDAMFALVDGEGSIFFKVDDTNAQMYQEAGSKKHFRMPYYRVPNDVLEDENVLREWAQASIHVSRHAK